MGAKRTRGKPSGQRRKRRENEKETKSGLVPSLAPPEEPVWVGLEVPERPCREVVLGPVLLPCRQVGHEEGPADLDRVGHRGLDAVEGPLPQALRGGRWQRRIALRMSQGSLEDGGKSPVWVERERGVSWREGERGWRKKLEGSDSAPRPRMVLTAVSRAWIIRSSFNQILRFQYLERSGRAKESIRINPGSFFDI